MWVEWECYWEVGGESLEALDLLVFNELLEKLVFTQGPFGFWLHWRVKRVWGAEYCFWVGTGAH